MWEIETGNWKRVVKAKNWRIALKRAFDKPPKYAGVLTSLLNKRSNVKTYIATSAAIKIAQE